MATNADRGVMVNGDQCVFIHLDTRKSHVKFVYAVPGVRSKWDKKGELDIWYGRQTKEQNANQLVQWLSRFDLASYLSDIRATLSEMPL